MTINRRWIITLCCLPSVGGVAYAAPLGTAFTYQGQLKLDGQPLNGSADFSFSLWDAAVGGNRLGPPLVYREVDVVNGLFAVEVDFGAGAFNGDARWVEVEVESPPGSGSHAMLSPRQLLTPAPYALALPALYTLPNTTSPNIVGGWTENSITSGVVGATLAGGGSPLIGGNPRPNRITDNYGAIAGGSGNTAGNNDGVTTNAEHSTVGGGYANQAGGPNSTVAGGWYNRATGSRSTAAGGWNNLASGDAATVSGGRDNSASGTASVIAGGAGNQATSSLAMVLGGTDNRAQGVCSLAAGRRAIADHSGSFVWSDYTDADFKSTGQNQFVVRAGGGVGINTAAPKTTLDVEGLARVKGANWPSTGEGMELGYDSALNRGYIQAYDRGTGAWGSLYLGDGKVGIGTTTPASKLTVVGTIESTSGGVKFPDGTVQTTAGSGLGLTLPYSGSCPCNDPRQVGPAFDVTNAMLGVAVQGTHESTGNKGYLGGELYGVYGQSATALIGSPPTVGAGVFGKNSGGGDGVRGESSTGFGVEGRGATGVVGIGDVAGVFGLSVNGHAAYFDGDAYLSGDVGIGTDAPSSLLDVQGEGTAMGGATGYPEVVARFRRTGSTHTAASIDAESGKDSILYFAEDGRARWDIRHDTDDADSLNIRYQGGTEQNWSVVRILSNGTTRVRVLEIVGGADLAEPFEVNPTNSDGPAVRPGLVVVIDPGNPGELKLSTEPYDRKVAGVISGANGLRPGMIMKSADNPSADGDHPVALSGRVWCYCDATAGAIEPGDLLTTSMTPGHAMKATDPARTQGAVVGKAMTSLPTGRGLVLVLVSLQ